MDVPDADICINHLEQLGSAVIEAVIQNDTCVIESLVIEQCQWMRKLQEQPIQAEYKPRLQKIAAAISTQQTLIGQALQVTGFFLQKLNETRAFSDFG